MPLLEEDPLELPTRLLLACLRLDSPQELDELAKAASPTDWQAVLLRAGELGVGPLLHQRLSVQEVAQRLPEGLPARIEQIYQEGVLNNLKAFQSLDRVLAALAGRQIPVIPLKGAYLVEKVFGRIGLRSMGDIDLLVQVERMHEAVQVLEELGYHASFPFQIETEIQHLHALPALENHLGLAVDLHWTLVPPTAPFHLPIDKIWQSAAPGSLRGFEILELAAEDLLLHLCLHAAYLDSFSSGLRPICDIAWTIQVYGQQLDWAVLVGKAQEWGMGRSAWLALMTAERLLHPPLPAGALAGLQPDPADLPILDWAVAQVLWPAELSRKLAGLWAPKPWYSRAVLLVRFSFPPRREMRPFYPRLGRGLLWPLAYSIHLVRVIRRNWGSARRLIGVDPQTSAAAVQSERASRLLEWQSASEQPERAWFE